MRFVWLCLLSAPVMAGGLQVNPGQWRFGAEREAEVAALGYHKKDQGVSQRCLSAAPLEDLRQWLSGKGCTIAATEEGANGVSLTGSCRFRFLPGQVLPMRGEIVALSAERFSLKLTAGRAGLRYQENTVAERQGDCPPAATSTAPAAR